jgi:hypothetical protein
VRVIIATSTLSEGVNIPVTYLLIPSVFRSQERLTLQEFANLIGRAGRPGVSTEGHVLVVLPERVANRRYQGRQWPGYTALIQSVQQLAEVDAAGAAADNASSPLAMLLSAIERSWRAAAGAAATPQQFTTWLEQTAVAPNDPEVAEAIQHLDSLDAFLLAAIEELEELDGAEIAAGDLEVRLTRIWQRSYAFAAAHDEARLRAIWLTRGRVIKEQYPDAATRRRIYKTSLAPRSALRLVARAGAIRTSLLAGEG